MQVPAFRVWASIALLALACALPLAGCGGSDDNDSGPAKTTASAENGSSGGGTQAETTQSSSGESSTSQGTGGEAEGAGSQPPAGAIPATPPTPGEASQDQHSSGQAILHPKKPHKPHSSGAGLSPPEAAAYETARALCANPDTLQYAPEEIRDDAEALAEFAERYAPQGEEQIVHDGCLVGLKSIGID